jgi:hypothetical protein
LIEDLLNLYLKQSNEIVLLTLVNTFEHLMGSTSVSKNLSAHATPAKKTKISRMVVPSSSSSSSHSESVASSGGLHRSVRDKMDDFLQDVAIKQLAVLSASAREELTHIQNLVTEDEVSSGDDMLIGLDMKPFDTTLGKISTSLKQYFHLASVIDIPGLSSSIAYEKLSVVYDSCFEMLEEIMEILIDTLTLKKQKVSLLQDSGAETKQISAEYSFIDEVGFMIRLTMKNMTMFISQNLLLAYKAGLKTLPESGKDGSLNAEKQESLLEFVKPRIDRFVKLIEAIIVSDDSNETEGAASFDADVKLTAFESLSSILLLKGSNDMNAIFSNLYTAFEPDVQEESINLLSSCITLAGFSDNSLECKLAKKIRRKHPVLSLVKSPPQSMESILSASQTILQFSADISKSICHGLIEPQYSAHLIQFFGHNSTLDTLLNAIPQSKTITKVDDENDESMEEKTAPLKLTNIPFPILGPVLSGFTGQLCEKMIVERLEVALDDYYEFIREKNLTSKEKIQAMEDVRKVLDQSAFIIDSSLSKVI